MPLFRTRPETVHATQWQPGSTDKDLYPGPIQPFMYALTECGLVRLEPGDWLVRRKPDDRPEVVYRDQFAALYEPAE